MDTYHTDRDIIPESDNEIRASFEKVLLSLILKKPIKRLIPGADKSLLDEAFKKISNLK